MESRYISDEFKNRVWALFSAQLHKTNTRNAYWTAVCRICDYLKKDFLEITAADAQEYFDMLSSGGITKKNGDRYTVASIYIFYSQLRAVSNFIIENNSTFHDLAHKAPFTFVKIKEPSQTVELSYMLSIKDIGRILTALKGTDLYFITNLAFRLGLSSNNIIKLRPSDVQVAKNDRLLLEIRPDSPLKSSRHLVVPEDMAADLQKYLDTVPLSCKTLFHNTRYEPLTRKTLDYNLKKATEKAGYKGVTLQRIRTSAGHHMAKAGATPTSIALQLGINERHVTRFTGSLDELEGQASEKLKID